MSERSESPPPPDWSPPASEGDAREVRQSLDSYAPPPPAREALRYSQDSAPPPPPPVSQSVDSYAAARQSQDSYAAARQSQDSYAPPPPPPRVNQEPAPPPWEDDDDDDDAAPRAWHDTDEDAAPRAPDDIGDDFAAADAWAREERVAAEEAKAFAALAADGPPPWADDDPDETTLWQNSKASKPAWADDDEEGETTALDDLDAAPVKVRRSSEQLERFSRLRKSRSPKKKAPDVDDGPPPQSALVAKLFGKRPAPKKPEAPPPQPVPLSMEDRQALEGELSKTEAELAEARAACRKLRADVDAAQRRATESLAERTSVRSQRQKELDEWIARERDVCKRESLALHRDRRSRRDERVNLDRQKKKEVERLKEEAAALRDQLEARARRDRLTERRLSDRNAQAEAKARELATQLSLLETQNAEAAAKRARRAAARAADRDAFGLRAAEVAAAKADAEETMRTRSSLNEETAASSQPSETFLDQPTTYFEAETRLEASYDAGRYASPAVAEDDDASDDGGDDRSDSAGDPRRSQDSYRAEPQSDRRRSQDSFVRAARANPAIPDGAGLAARGPRREIREGLGRRHARGEISERHDEAVFRERRGRRLLPERGHEDHLARGHGRLLLRRGGHDAHDGRSQRIETFEFPNGQYERHFASGEKEIRFPDGTVKLVRADGGTETTFADGQVVVEEPPDRRPRAAIPGHFVGG